MKTYLVIRKDGDIDKILAARVKYSTYSNWTTFPSGESKIRFLVTGDDGQEQEVGFYRASEIIGVVEEAFFQKEMFYQERG